METIQVIQELNLIDTYSKKKEQQWTEIIELRTWLQYLGLKDVWRYRILVILFVRRNFTSTYNQIIQSLLTAITFILIFGRGAKLPTDSLPFLIIHPVGIIIWNYFEQTLTATSIVYNVNAQMFWKKYFPRLTMPLSVVNSDPIRFGIQFRLNFIKFNDYQNY